MTVASLADKSTGPKVVPGVGSDGAAGDSPTSAAPSHLGELKRERNELRRQLSRLQEARAELEEPGIELQRLEGERQSLELEAAGAVADWVSRGCEGARPVSDAKRLGDIARRRETARAAASTNAAQISELDRHSAELRARLGGIDDQIATEAVAVLAGELDPAVAAVQAAADQLNVAYSHVTGLRAFLLQPGASAEFMRLAEKIFYLQDPKIGASRPEVEAAAAVWAQKFTELTK